MMPSASRKFPAGLRVLVVDDDRTCLMVLATTLRKCNYEVTKCDRGDTALSLLRENKSGFDVVISDVHMPDMDGFKLLVRIGLEMDLPVIMMSADDSKDVVMKGVTHGACDYLIKPVRIEALRNIWQHVVRKKKHLQPSDDGEKHPQYFSSAKRRKHEEEEEEEEEAKDDDSSSSVKKPRVTWTQQLHQQFLAAVIQLGFDKAVPKKILDLMNVPGITRENVASHLQKFRLYLRKLKAEQSDGMKMKQDASYEFDPAVGQVQAAAGALGRSGNSLVDQHGSFIHGMPSFTGSQPLIPPMYDAALRQQPVLPSSLVDIPGSHRTLQHIQGFVSGYGLVNQNRTHASWGLQDSSHHGVNNYALGSQVTFSAGKGSDSQGVNDLLTAILTQQQQGIGDTENEYAQFG